MMLLIYGLNGQIKVPKFDRTEISVKNGITARRPYPLQDDIYQKHRRTAGKIRQN